MKAKRARIKLRDEDTLEVLVNPGYVEFVQRGEVVYTITLPRDKLVVLLKWLIPHVRKMPSSVDPIATLREWAEIDDTQKYERRQRRRSPRRSKKRRR